MPSPPDRRDAISLSGVLLTAGFATLVKLRKGTFAWTFVLLSILGAIVILGSALLSWHFPSLHENDELERLRMRALRIANRIQLCSNFPDAWVACLPLGA
jgi:hypothetical protein